MGTHDVASALAVDPSTGDVVVCGSTSANIPNDDVIDDDAVRGAERQGVQGSSESFCTKLAAVDGQVGRFSRALILIYTSCADKKS